MSGDWGMFGPTMRGSGGSGGLACHGLGLYKVGIGLKKALNGINIGLDVAIF